MKTTELVFGLSVVLRSLKRAIRLFAKPDKFQLALAGVMERVVNSKKICMARVRVQQMDYGQIRLLSFASVAATLSMRMNTVRHSINHLLVCLYSTGVGSIH